MVGVVPVLLMVLVVAMVRLVVLVVLMFAMVLVHSSSNGSGGSKDCCRSGIFNGYGSSGCFEGCYYEGLTTKVYKRAIQIANCFS